MIREVSVSARAGGGDPDGNPRLRAAMDAAFAANIPRDTVQRAIDKATGSAGDMDALEEIRYEGYGPAGVAFVVDCQTDNRNRTAGEVRHAFTKAGGKLGGAGSVLHLFHSCAIFTVGEGADYDQLFERVAEANAEDLLRREDGGIDVIAPVSAFADVRQVLQDNSFAVANSVITVLPHECMQIDDDDVPAVQTLLTRLDEIDDVQSVYCNLEPELVEACGGG